MSYYSDPWNPSAERTKKLASLLSTYSPSEQGAPSGAYPLAPIDTQYHIANSTPKNIALFGPAAPPPQPQFSAPMLPDFLGQSSSPSSLGTGAPWKPSNPGAGNTTFQDLFGIGGTFGPSLGGGGGVMAGINLGPDPTISSMGMLSL